MTTAGDTSTAFVQDLVFAEVAMRHELIGQESLTKGWAVFEEMSGFGIKRSLASILVERKLISHEQAKEVVQHVARIQVRCSRCNGGVPLKFINKDDHLKCGRCGSILAPVVREGTGADDVALQDRIETTLVKAATPSEEDDPAGNPAAVRAASSVQPSPDDTTRIPRHDARSIIKRFDIDSVLHSGPLGRLYRARPARTEGAPRYVVKVFDGEASADAHALARLKDALDDWNSVAESKRRASHSVYQEEQLTYVCRPLFNAPFGSLADLRLNEQDEREAVLSRVTSLVADLHQEERVHGNLKPSNVMLRVDPSKRANGAMVLLEDRFRHAFLVDPALNHLLPRDNDLARWQLAVKSPRYVAPEVLDGREATRASDIYSLGWVFFAVLSGTAPFSGLRPPEILTRHLQGPVPELPDELERWQPLITHMTAVDPSERPSDASAVLDVVEDLRLGQSYSAPTVKARCTPPEIARVKAATRKKASRKPKKRSFRFLVGPILLALALGWVGWCVVSWYRATPAATEERKAELAERLMQSEFRRIRAEASANPNVGLELWRQFLEAFPTTPLRAHVEAEMRNYPDFSLPTGSSGQRPGRRR